MDYRSKWIVSGLLLILVGIIFSAPVTAHAVVVAPAPGTDHRVWSWVENTSGVEDVYKVVLGLVDLVVVLGLLAAAFANIFSFIPIKLDSYKVKQILPGLIIGIVMANLSYFIMHLFIEVSTIFVQMVGIIVSQQIGDTIGTQSGTGYLVTTLWREILGSLIKLPTAWAGLSGIVTAVAGGGGILTAGATLAEMFAAIGTSLTLNPLGGAIGIIFGLLLLAPLITALILAFLLYIRGYILIICFVLSPLAFFSLGFPPLKTFWNKWWTNFWKWLIMAPLAFLVLGGGIIFLHFANNAAGGSRNLTDYVFFNGVGIGFLLMAIKIPFSFGSFFGTNVMKEYNNWSKRAAKTGWDGGVRGTAYLNGARKAIGGHAGRWNNIADVKDKFAAANAAGKAAMTTDKLTKSWIQNNPIRLAEGVRAGMKSRLETADKADAKMIKKTVTYKGAASREAKYRDYTDSNGHIKEETDPRTLVDDHIIKNGGDKFTPEELNKLLTESPGELVELPIVRRAEQDGVDLEKLAKLMIAWKQYKSISGRKNIKSGVLDPPVPARGVPDDPDYVPPREAGRGYNALVRDPDTGRITGFNQRRFIQGNNDEEDGGAHVGPDYGDDGNSSSEDGNNNPGGNKPAGPKGPQGGGSGGDQSPQRGVEQGDSSHPLLSQSLDTATPSVNIPANLDIQQMNVDAITGGAVSSNTLTEMSRSQETTTSTTSTSTSEAERRTLTAREMPWAANTQGDKPEDTIGGNPEAAPGGEKPKIDLANDLSGVVVQGNATVQGDAHFDNPAVAESFAKLAAMYGGPGEDAFRMMQQFYGGQKSPDQKELAQEAPRPWMAALKEGIDAAAEAAMNAGRDHGFEEEEMANAMQLVRDRSDAGTEVSAEDLKAIADGKEWGMVMPELSSYGKKYGDYKKGIDMAIPEDMQITEKAALELVPELDFDHTKFAESLENSRRFLDDSLRRLANDTLERDGLRAIKDRLGRIYKPAALIPDDVDNVGMQIQLRKMATRTRDAVSLLQDKTMTDAFSRGVKGQDLKVALRNTVRVRAIEDKTVLDTANLVDKIKRDIGETDPIKVATNQDVIHSVSANIKTMVDVHPQLRASIAQVSPSQHDMIHQQAAQEFTQAFAKQVQQSDSALKSVYPTETRQQIGSQLGEIVSRNIQQAIRTNGMQPAVA